MFWEFSSLIGSFKLESDQKKIEVVTKVDSQSC